MAQANYRFEVFEKPGDMYRSYEVARILNPTMTKDDYKYVIDRISKTSNYKQHVVLHDEKVVSMVATQDVLMMGAAPRLTCKIDNVATLPEHRGKVTSELMRRVIDGLKKDDYGNICLDCDKRNERGSNFYKNMGFEPTNNGWVMRLDNRNRKIER